MRMWVVVKYNAFGTPFTRAIDEQSDPMDCCSREATNTKGEDQVERAYHHEIAENGSGSQQLIHSHSQCVIRIAVKFVTCLARHLVY
jgi:hypothetical protein